MKATPKLRKTRLTAEEVEKLEKIFGEMLDVDELKAGLKLPSKNWIYQRIHTNTLPFKYIKMGHYLRFPADSVREWLESQTRPGSAA